MIQLVLENRKNFKSQRGFVVLMSVILLSVVGVAIVTSYLLLGLGNRLSGSVFQNELSATYLAESCVEKTLMSIKEDISYLGGEQVEYPEGICEILPIEENTGVYTIKVQAMVGQVVRKILVVSTAQGDGIITVNSWNETADF